MSNPKYSNCDFSGWATRNDLLCGDGRIIKRDAFKDNDGKKVSLVYNHNHDDPNAVLGHAFLENRAEGVYAYCYFNDTESGKTANELVHNGDVSSLSIWANKLKQNKLANGAKEVLRGDIKELSLVLAGANPGAYIDCVMAHSDDNDEDESLELYASWNENIIIHSADSTKKNTKEDAKVENETKKTDGEEKKPEGEKTVGEIFDTFTEEQKNVIYAMVSQALEDAGDDNKNEEDIDMKHNVFDNETNEKVLSHAAMDTIIGDAKRYGSLKESFMAHSDEYGIENIDWLFPEAKTLNNQPELIKRQPGGWVDIVMKGVHHTPFSRVKSMFADITADEARAKGYVKGNLKMEEVITLLKRTTEPFTVYKKQKLDRDDIVDITDFDVVAFLKAEMRGELDEEIARAIVFGDKRNALSPDKIDETKIRPIITDADLFTIKKTVTVAQGEETGHAIIKAAVKAQDDYQGSGNLTFFTAAGTVSDMLLLEDGQGRRLYKDMSDLALAMNVNKIVKVPAGVVPTGFYGVIVDLNDYNVGADKGGSINMFDDFDIDYNQQKYLIETRCSGALVKPYSAIALKVAAQG